MRVLFINVGGASAANADVSNSPARAIKKSLVFMHW